MVVDHDLLETKFYMHLCTMNLSGMASLMAHIFYLVQNSEIMIGFGNRFKV